MICIVLKEAQRLNENSVYSGSLGLPKWMYILKNAQRNSGSHVTRNWE